MSTNNNPSPKGEQCGCGDCGLTFVGLKSFDKHRVGEYGLPHGHPLGRRCCDVAEMRSAGMQPRPDGLWRIAATQKLPTGTYQPRAQVAPYVPTGHPVHALKTPCGEQVATAAPA